MTPHATRLRTAALASALLLAACSAQAGEIRAHIDVRMPENADNPVPAVVMLSGCGGVRAVQDIYAGAANAAGWAAMIVDSHAARGLDGIQARLLVCTGAVMRGGARAQDVFTALQAVREDSRLDSRRVVLAGWSHGGWTILDAMAAAEDGAGALDPVAGAFLLYPYCGFPVRARNAPLGDPFPVTAVLAGRDSVANPQDCEALFEERRSEGSRISVQFEPALTHAFDAPDQPWDPRMEYDEDGARRALAAFSAFLEETESAHAAAQ